MTGVFQVKAFVWRAPIFCWPRSQSGILTNRCGTFAGGLRCLVIRPDPELSPYDTEHHPVTCGRHIVLARQAGEGNWSNPFSRDLRWRSLRSNRIPEPPVVNSIIFICLGLSVLDSLTSVLQLEDEQGTSDTSPCTIPLRKYSKGSLRSHMHLRLTSLTRGLYVAVGQLPLAELVVCWTP